MSEFYMHFSGTELDSALNKVKNHYVDKNKMFHMATGIVANVTAGQTFSVTGIKDEKKGESFDVKGVFACIDPYSATNFIAGSGKPALVAFFRAPNSEKVVCISAYSSAYSVRINPNNASTYMTVNGNSFTYDPPTSGMYEVMAAERWRWIAWG